MEKRERYDMMSRYKEDEKIQYQQRFVYLIKGQYLGLSGC